MWLDLSENLHFCIVLLGLLIFFFLIKNREFKGNLWLAWLNFVLSFHFLNLWLIDKINLPFFGLVFGLLYGPVIMLFVKAHYEESEKSSIGHFIPALFLFFWIITVDMNRAITPLIELSLLRFFVLAHLLFYLILAFKYARQFKEVTIQTRSKLGDRRIRLVQKIIAVIAVILIIALIESYIEIIQGHFYAYILLLISAIVVLGMVGIIYESMENPFVFSNLTAQEKHLALEARRQYASSGLTNDMANEYKQVLISKMTIDKPYKRDSLSIDDLAEFTQLPSRYISQIINQRLGQNFYDFINAYRIEEAREQLENTDKRISEIMYDVGFSSRSSFNTAFKKYTKLTPSQYRRKMIKN